MSISGISSGICAALLKSLARSTLHAVLSLCLGAAILLADDTDYQQNYQAQITDIAQLDHAYGFSYPGLDPIHLSGMAVQGNQLYIIGDKPHDQHLYAIEKQGHLWKIVSRVPLDIDHETDLEGAYACANAIFLVDEKSSRVYRYTSGKPARALDIDLSTVIPNPEAWGNAGFEGIALNCETGDLFLAKERNPRFILGISLSDDAKTGRVEDQIQFDAIQPDITPLSFSDLYFDGGYLYALSRNHYRILKIDPHSKQIVASLSFSQLRDDAGSLYKNDGGFGLAEALVLTPARILLGLDNNGQSVRSNTPLAARFGLSGNQPSIVVIERPQGF